MTGRLSLIVVPKLPVSDLAEVLEVLHDDRPVVAGGVRCALRAGLGPSRPPSAAVIGSPVVRIRKNTRVTRMKIGREDQEEADQQVPAEASAADDFGFGRPGAGRILRRWTRSSVVLMDSSGVQGNGGDPR